MTKTGNYQKNLITFKVIIIITLLLVLPAYLFLYQFQIVSYISKDNLFTFDYYNFYENKVSEYKDGNVPLVPLEKYNVDLRNMFIILDIGIFNEKCSDVINRLSTEDKFKAKYLETPQPSSKLYNNKKEIVVYNMENVQDEYMLDYSKLACIEDEGKSALIGGVLNIEYKQKNILSKIYDYLLFRRVVETFRFTN